MNIDDNVLSFWKIKVTGYGEFLYFGTPKEADGMRQHKASWEGGKGTLKKVRDLTPEESMAIGLWCAAKQDGFFNPRDGKNNDKAKA